MFLSVLLIVIFKLTSKSSAPASQFLIVCRAILRVRKMLWIIGCNTGRGAVKFIIINDVVDNKENFDSFLSGRNSAFYTIFYAWVFLTFSRSTVFLENSRILFIAS